ncbi:hypothetical protein [Macrococcus animalis]|uniref:hypothetical protein n=1 Tax=Macrococcus animalis TaxID=3395467 RepID=UPI0039BDE66B
MKKLILLLSTTLILTACGPSETEQLTKEKNDLKKEVSTVKNKLDNEKTKRVSKNNTLASIESELKQAKSGNTITNDLYTQNFKDYAAKLGTAFESYASIDTKIDQINKNSSVALKLGEVKATIIDAIRTYEAPFKKSNPPEAFEEIHKQIEDANKNMKKAISKIEKGYDKKDKALLNEGKETLQKVIDQFNEIQFQ